MDAGGRAAARWHASPGIPSGSPGVVDETFDMKTADRKQVNDLPLADYFTYLAELLKTNPPKPEDAPIVALMAEIGIVPGQDFDHSKLPKLGHRLEPKLALLELVHAMKSKDPVNGWLRWPELAVGQYQEHTEMTPESPEIPVTEGARSLEVRWIFPGQLEAAVAGWFERFPARTESREDTYLLEPRLGGLSVKVRGGGALEVKAYRGSPGILEVTGRASGRLESWQKWSFPVSPLSQVSGDPPGWRPVRKRRRLSRFPLGSGQAVRTPGWGRVPGCEVELTEVHTRGQDWWSLGFEATGPTDLLRGTLELPPRSCSPRPCPVVWKLARMNPGPMPSGWTSGQAPRVPKMPERRPWLAGPSWPLLL